MKEIKTIGLDLAKNTFHVVCCDRQGVVVRKKQLRRSQVLNYFAQLPAALVGMEACAGAHDWGRKLEALGHRVKLLPAQHVKAYLQGNKNDYNDAWAIAEAVVRPGIRGVPLKTEAEQARQGLIRLRERRIQERTALCNQCRGLLAEQGRVYPEGVGVLRRALVRLQEDVELEPLLRRLMALCARQLQELDAHIDAYTAELRRVSQQSVACRQLQTIPGFGPVVATAFYSHVGRGTAFRRGRDVAASLGLVPRQHSTGGKPVLLGISKRGDRYLRGLLVHGARSVVCQAAGKEDALSRWVNRVRARRGFNRAVVALANKMARMGWAVLAHQTEYQVN